MGQNAGPRKSAPKTSGAGSPVDIGSRIRECRQQRGLSLRRLAGEIGITPGALSQIETGKSRPSVNTLYAIVHHLEITLDMLTSGITPPQPRAHVGVVADAGAVEYIPVPAQNTIALRGDETMRRVSGPALTGVECVTISYAPLSCSPHDGGFVTHDGRELNYLMSGELIVEVGSQTFALAPGDSLSFPATEPHRLRNPGSDTAEVFTVFTSERESDRTDRHH